MSALEHRPAFGDVYVSEGDSYRTHTAAAVRVLGWTPKRAIVERLPLTTQVTLSHPFEHRTVSVINAAAMRPLPATPRTRSGPHELMLITIADALAPVAGDVVVLQLEASDAAGRDFRQVFTRCADIDSWHGTTTRYY